MNLDNNLDKKDDVSIPYLHTLSENQKKQLVHIHSQLVECQRDYDINRETSNRNGEALKQIERDINDLRQRDRQTIIEQHQQMINIQEGILEFQNKTLEFQNKTLEFEKKMNEDIFELQNNLNR